MNVSTMATRTSLKTILKRDGSEVPFDINKIINAVEKAMNATDEYKKGCPELIAVSVEVQLLREHRKNPDFIPTVEIVQDFVEIELMNQHFPATAKAYIIYRSERTKKREETKPVPEHLQRLALESKQYFQDNPLGEFVYLRTYARWIKSEGRRETWIETVDRYMDFMKENLGDKLTTQEYSDIRGAILRQEIMPSMRLMQFAGDPARRCNTCAYNCSFIAPSKIEDFAEIMYLSMQGCGVGFSVESQNIEQLPQIAKQQKRSNDSPIHIVQDSKEGWCDALTMGLQTWYAGKDIKFDYSLIRPAGSRLNTMGGKASGPEPLKDLLNFARNTIFKRRGKRLRSIDAHDIICKIGECVVSGGVRRTAMISLSDLDDTELRDAKKGQFYITDPHRSISNNSAVYESTPSNTELMEEWMALMKSGSGERGIFNRGSLDKTIPERRKAYFKKKGLFKNGKVTGSVGVNPCGEIILQSKQFCNLTEVIARESDTKETLLEKIRLATILGTYQASLTNFSYISEDWSKNCQEERLLGVSVTGQWDSEEARKPDTLKALKEKAVKTNEEYAKRFGVNPSTAITAVKPSGTVSQTFNTASGIHPRHSKYYIRRVRISATDSLFKMLKEQGFPYQPEVGQTEDNANTYVLSFPVAAPGNIFKDDITALDQLEYWKNVKLNYTEHNPSATISIGEDEWIPVLNWVQKNWDIIGGLSFLPRFDHVYRLAPYEEIDKATYDEMVSKIPTIDYAKLVMYELQDETEQKKELACAGGACEVDLTAPTKSKS